MRSTRLLIAGLILGAACAAWLSRAPGQSPAARPAAVLKDATGVVFPHPGHVSRIVSLAPSLTQEIFALGAGDALIADTTYCRYPAAAQTKTKIGSTLSPDLELIVSLHPDLIVATLDGNRLATVGQLRRAGLAVFVTHSASDFADVQANFLILARLLGRSSAAQAVLEQAQRQIATERARVAGLPPVRTFFELQQMPLVSANDDTFIGEELRDAGAINVMGRTSSRYPRLSEEAVLHANPDAILVDNEQSDPARAVSNWTRFPSLAAARQRHIFLVSSHLFDTPTPMNFADAVHVASHLLHPEAP